MTAFCNHFIRVDLCDVCSPIKDPRDADLARLKAEVERLTAAVKRLRDGFDVQVEAITRRDRALAAGMLAHTKNDDAKRLDLAECRTSLAIESEVADVCMAVVEQCRAVVEGHACSCWRVTE